ncbi:MAG: phosphodiester glycosidase family protein [Defluviitaleaceae bacterium]|nr:phosphodiester glycosidase family protein [Defluviitaleaceae bacterium]
MRKYIAKLSKNILVLGLSALILLQPVTMEAAFFFQMGRTENMAAGITYEDRLMATRAGLINVSVVYVDIHTPYVELRPIAPAAYGSRASVSSMVLESGAMAGINADFFDMGINPSTPFGDVVADGQVISMDVNRPGYSTFFIDGEGNPFIEYIEPEFIFLNNGQRNLRIHAMNKFLRDFSAVYFDRNAITDTAGLDARFSDLWKYVVEDGRITYIGTSTVTVPENGFIIVAAARYAGYFTESVRVGDTAEFRVEARFDYNQMQAAIGGAGKILLNGEPADCGFVVAPNARHPRSAIGISRDGTRVILAVVDGRGISIGATHAEMAEIMLGLGAYHAAHFDGGGSSTLVADTHFMNGAAVRNRPSDGAQRAVVNALGVFHTAEIGEVTSLLINPSSERVFMGDSVTLDVRGLDANERIAPLNPERLSFSATEAGRWEGNTFYTSEFGLNMLYAIYNDVAVGYVYLNTLDLAQIIPQPSQIRVNSGASQRITMRGIGMDGTTAPLRNAAFEVVPAELGTVTDDGVFTANSGGVTQGFIRVTSSGVNAFIPVSVGTVTEWVTGFDQRDIPIEFSGVGNGVTGSVAYDDSLNNPGNFALRLNYQFGVSELTQAAYLNLMEPITFDNNLYAFEIAVFGHGGGGWVRASVRDAAGEVHLIDIAPNVDFSGWRNHIVRIPEGAMQPVSLEQFYVVALRNDNTSELSLFFDDLRAQYAVPIGDVAVPAGDRFRNPFEAVLSADKQVGHIDLTFVGNTIISDEDLRPDNYGNLQRNALLRFTQTADQAFFVGPADTEVVEGIRFSGNYHFRSHGNYAIIEMSARTGSLAGTSPGNWAFFNEAANSDARHIIILLDRRPDTFNMTAEYELFHQALRELREDHGKTVFVVTASGLSSSSTVIDGINYINLGALFNLNGEINNEFRILRIRIDGNRIAFELQSSV